MEVGLSKDQMLVWVIENWGDHCFHENRHGLSCPTTFTSECLRRKDSAMGSRNRAYRQYFQSCARSDYRRQGLARIVIQECLYRLKGMRMEKAHITGYSEGAIALYGSLSAQKRTEFFIFRHKS